MPDSARSIRAGGASCADSLRHSRRVDPGPRHVLEVLHGDASVRQGEASQAACLLATARKQATGCSARVFEWKRLPPASALLASRNKLENISLVSVPSKLDENEPVGNPDFLNSMLSSHVSLKAAMTIEHVSTLCIPKIPGRPVVEERTGTTIGVQPLLR